ncbi:hypothetical protein PFTANZ_03735 [Plasmodium falciparum Tanzania (2000708)]|uniref:Uncharacterized protein n=1 Tax=Plasmodium falciparum Tanzania (2000708) TaxID=1036725 RepID=A0A024W4C9_PLAFA|nr:hypothetical protein PFTANZ_03735 [Plasmodium falciparum Tanzania (2000708)]
MNMYTNLSLFISHILLLKNYLPEKYNICIINKIKIKILLKKMNSEFLNALKNGQKYYIYEYIYKIVKKIKYKKEKRKN